jgi:hypothetical protein
VKPALATLLFLSLAPFAQADVKTKAVSYDFEGTPLKGHLAWDDSSKEKRPGVLVVQPE